MKKIFQSCHGYFCNENVLKVFILAKNKLLYVPLPLLHADVGNC